MKYLLAAAAASLLLFSESHAQIQPVVNGQTGQGAIDWQNRMITVTGIGAPNPNQPMAAQRPGALRAAKMVALRNALETIKGIYLSSQTTVANFMTEQDNITTSVDGFLKGFQQQGRTKYMSDGSVEITMTIPLDGVGGIGEVLLGDQLTPQPSTTTFDGPAAAKAQIFTGLIIDCKGLNVKPALSPRVVDEDNREIYGSAFVSRDWAIKQGMVGYAKELDAAAKLSRVGETPGKVKAIRTVGDNATDVVIRKADAEDVRSAAENLKFLSECRVVFVID